MIVAMTAPNHHAYDTDILETLSQRVMVGDGAMGTQLEDADLRLDDVNNRRRRGRDETFGCNLVNLGDYGIAGEICELALKGTAIAKRVGSSWASRLRVTT
jgi:5-methyltetrahydrofolate--homocysteine methyltransferase